MWQLQSILLVAAETTMRKTSENTNISLIASGSEVEIALEAQEKLKSSNIDSKVISVPCYDLFINQSQNYKDEILGKKNAEVLAKKELETL